MTLLLGLLGLVTSVQPSSQFYFPFDCDDIYTHDNKSSSGVYRIYPGGLTTPVHVYCDMLTDGGRWTVSITEEQCDIMLWEFTWAVTLFMQSIKLKTKCFSCTLFERGEQQQSPILTVAVVFIILLTQNSFHDRELGLVATLQNKNQDKSVLTFMHLSILRD